MPPEKNAPGPVGWLAEGPGAGGDATRTRVARQRHAFPPGGTYQPAGTRSNKAAPRIGATSGHFAADYCTDCDQVSVISAAERAVGMPPLCQLHLDARAGRTVVA